MNSKRLTMFIRLISLMLVIFTILPTLEPLISFGKYYYGDQGAGQEGYSTGSSWGANFNVAQQGIRLSIVNADHELVIDQIVDIYFSLPQKLGINEAFYLDNGSNKFGDNTGTPKRYGVLEFNCMLYDALQRNPDMQEQFNNLVSNGFTVDRVNSYPSSIENYSGLPLPVLADDGLFSSNGANVRKFFVDGDLGVIRLNTGAVNNVPLDNFGQGFTPDQGGSVGATDQNQGGNTNPPSDTTTPTNPTTPTTPTTPPSGTNDPPSGGGNSEENIGDTTPPGTEIDTTVPSPSTTPVRNEYGYTNAEVEARRLYIQNNWRRLIMSNTSDVLQNVPEAEKHRIENNIKAYEKALEAALIVKLQSILKYITKNRFDRSKWEEYVSSLSHSSLSGGDIVSDIRGNYISFGYQSSDALNQAAVGEYEYETLITNNAIANYAEDTFIKLCRTSVNLLKDATSPAKAEGLLNSWIDVLQSGYLDSHEIVRNGANISADEFVQLPYNEIPLVSGNINNTYNTNDGSSGNTVTDSAINSVLSNIKDPFIRRMLEALSKTEEELESVIRGAYPIGDSANVFIDSLVGTVGATAEAVFNMLNSMVTSGGDLEQINTQINNAIHATKEYLNSEEDKVTNNNTQSNGNQENVTSITIDPDSLGLDMEGWVATDGVVFTPETVKQTLVSYAASLSSANGLEITYEDLLSIMEPINGTEEMKIQNAINIMYKLTTSGFLQTLPIGNLIRSWDNGGSAATTIYKNAGYLGGVLDMIDAYGNFVFEIDIDPAKQADYDKACAKTKLSEIEKQRPSRRFAYCGYALVIEPIYWVRPVSPNLNSIWAEKFVSVCGANCEAWRNNNATECKHIAKHQGSNIFARCNRYLVGTPTNWAKFMSIDNNHYPEDYAHQPVHNQFAECMYIDENLEYFNGGKITPQPMQTTTPSIIKTANSPGGFTYGYQKFRSCLSNMDTTSPDFSYGWHIIIANTQVESLQVTWNNTVGSPDRAPDPKDLPDPSKKSDGTPAEDPDYPNGIPDKHFNIVKYYRTIIIERTDGVETGRKEERQGPTIRTQNPNKIEVIGVEPATDNKGQFTVTEWYTTGSTNLPSEGDTNETYEVRKSMDGYVQSSPVPQIVILDKENNGKEVTLAVLLERKIYVDKSGTNTTVPNSGSDIVISESQISKTIHTDSPTIGHSESTTWHNYKFKFKLTEFIPKTVDGHHQSISYGSWVPQPIPNCNNCKYTSEPKLNGVITLPDGKGGFTPFPNYDDWYTSTTCGGHDHPYYMPGGAGDNKLQFVFGGLHSITSKGLQIPEGKHELTDPKVYSNDGKHDKQTNTLNEIEWEFNSNGNDQDGADYVTVLWRYTDVPTMPTYKEADIRYKYNSEENWEVPSSILYLDSKIPKLKRVANGTNNDLLLMRFGLDKNKSDIRVTASCNNPSNYFDCFHKSVKDAIVSPGFDWSYEFNAKVEIQTWRGEDKQLADMPFTGTGETKKEVEPKKHYKYTILQNNQVISFYPYVRMTYMTNTLDQALKEDNKTPDVRYETYVFAEQISEILPSDAVEVGWDNAGEGNLNLTSQQWSLHQKAINGSDGWQGRNQVLPGGAIYQLDTGNNDTDVKLTTYQTVVDSKTRSYLEPSLTGDDYTSDKVQNDHKNFIEIAWDVIDNLKVVQWVTSDLSADTAWPKDFDESKANNQVKVTGGGQSLSDIGLKTTTNSDDKYYMNKADVGAEANQGDLDIIKAEQKTTIYKVFTDTEGKVYVAVMKDVKTKLTEDKKSPDDGFIESLIDKMKDINADTKDKTVANVSITELTNITKTTKYQDVLDSLPDEFKKLDERTSIITNLVMALERGTGDDKTAAWAKSDGKWYNEAFDGIYVVKQESKLTIGFRDPAKRASALDTALCPENRGQSDLYTSAMMSQFCLDSKSDSTKASGKDVQYISTFRNQDLQLLDMQEMYTTRKFYIPNANVQDLN